jgi:uncharacterized protein (DUF1800 family)
MSFGYSLAEAEPDSLKQVISKVMVTDNFKEIKVTEAGKYDRMQLAALSTDEKKALRKGKQEEFRTLNAAWLYTMAESKDLLREKLALFWHGHFACRNGIPFFMEEMVNLLRKNALSDFKTILTSVSKSAAMLQFLNNQQNRKAHPNENFARELLELFTLGRGHYTEDDVNAAARSFTGWGFTEDGEFEFREQQHDAGEKTFLGNTGNWKGDDILRIILEQKQCAEWICTGFWKFFISDTTDAPAIKKIAEEYYQSGYDTMALFKSIIHSDWFYADAYIGARIKSPVELIVPFLRDFHLQFVNAALLFQVQRVLGQVLLFPPNVAGWPGGTSWIDSSSLIYRMKLGRILLYNENPETAPKDDGDVNGFAAMDAAARQGERMKVNSDWSDIYKNFNDDAAVSGLYEKIIALKDWKPDAALWNKYTAPGDQDEKLKTTVLHLMSLPEYQLC